MKTENESHNPSREEKLLESIREEIRKARMNSQYRQLKKLIRMEVLLKEQAFWRSA